jgi:signal transduction histidine kinase
MRLSTSLLQSLRQTLPHLRSQVYFKASLMALSRAMEDLVLTGTDRPLVLINFDKERFDEREIRRYQKIAQKTDRLYLLAPVNCDSDLVPGVTITLGREDALAYEWHVVIVSQHYAACLVCQGHSSPIDPTSLEQGRQFQGIWTFDRFVSLQAAKLLLDQISIYRPDLSVKIEETKQQYGLNRPVRTRSSTRQLTSIDFRLFTARLMTYLQASQYKLQKAYRSIASQELRERLINSIATTIRSSLNPEEVLGITVKELGNVYNSCRCLLYRFHPTAPAVPIEYESVALGLPALQGEIWSLATHPLFQTALTQNRAIAVADVERDLGLQVDLDLKAQLLHYQIRSFLLVPIRYRETWLGMLELHHAEARLWNETDIGLVEAIAAQAGVALMQAQAYTGLKNLNQQLADLERTQSNLIAIVGHELRTPLSTIQVCLESLASDLQMPLDSQQIMLQTALGDLERLRQLVQDFLLLSRLESGLISWQPEPTSLSEFLDLAIGRWQANQLLERLPKIILDLPDRLPLVHADGEGLIEILKKLLDNAGKFTPSSGKVTISARAIAPDPVDNSAKNRMVEVTITDTGRGIEPNRLETIFERFYQEEGFLQRSVGGTGLGLVICRRLVEKLGGKIWAKSLGKDRGSQFYFTIPVAIVIY